jgi:dihydrolipoamide dehydrogenase
METREDAPLDVVIVGAGTAGLAAMREVRKRTNRFVLVNDGPYGTTCARVGCMPSKALIAAADALHGRTRLDEFGIAGGEGLEADLARGARARAGAARSLRLRRPRDDGRSRGAEPRGAGAARRTEPGRGRRAGAARAADRARARLEPRGAGPVAGLGDRVLTTDTLFEQADLPPRIAVIGLGAIGVEIAQALARLGVEVHAFDASRHVAGLADPAVEAALRTALADEFRLTARGRGATGGGRAGVAVVAGERRGSSSTGSSSRSGAGRTSRTSGWRRSASRSTTGDAPVDPETMRIGDTPVLLAGDANGDPTAPARGRGRGHIAGLNATSPHPSVCRGARPSASCSAIPAPRPSERLADLDPTRRWSARPASTRQGRARTMLRNRGVLRIYASRSENGRILGAEMACPAAEHMAHLLALAIGQRPHGARRAADAVLPPDPRGGAAHGAPCGRGAAAALPDLRPRGLRLAGGRGAAMTMQGRGRRPAHLAAAAVPDQDGAVEKTRTSTGVTPQRPQRCASTNSATTARDGGEIAKRRGLHKGPCAPCAGPWRAAMGKGWTGSGSRAWNGGWRRG